MYHFTPPKKHKKIYILINVLIILLIISITAFFHDRIEIFGIPLALWCLSTACGQLTPIGIRGFIEMTNLHLHTDFG